MLVLEGLVKPAAEKFLDELAATLRRRSRMLRILQLDVQIPIRKLNDKIHGLHAVTQSVLVLEPPPTHRIGNVDLQVPFRERHPARPRRLRLVSRSYRSANVSAIVFGAMLR